MGDNKPLTALGLMSGTSLDGVDAALIEAIAGRCTETDSGARKVDHILTHTLLPELSTRVLERMAEGEEFSAVHVSLGEGGGFAYEFRAGGPPARARAR